MSHNNLAHAYEIYKAATPVIEIHGLEDKLWKRNVAKGSRIGPWLSANFTITNPNAWVRREPCLYLVAGGDEVIRYVGISRNRMKDRWRTSPAYDHETLERWPENQLFHSQCWRHIEREYIQNEETTYSIRCITGDKLLKVIERLGPPLSAFAVLKGDAEGIVAGVERWICNNKSQNLVTWNVAMTT